MFSGSALRADGAEQRDFNRPFLVETAVDQLPDPRLERAYRQVTQHRLGVEAPLPRETLIKRRSTDYPQRHSRMQFAQTD